jgi:hypothetical protein
MVPCSMQFLMPPLLRSSDRASPVIFTTAPRSAATAGLAFPSSRSSSKSQSPGISWSGSSWWRLLSLRRWPAYWEPCPAESATQPRVSAAASGAEAAGGADAIAELAPLALAAL